MYATPHTAVGFSIIVMFKDRLEIGIPLAIFSHFILDFIDEKGLTSKDRLYFDLTPGLICFVLAIITGNFWLLLLGSICGNLFDLIDKKLYLAIFIPSKFKPTYYFHKHKQIIFPSAKMTKVIGWISTIIIGIILFY